MAFFIIFLLAVLVACFAIFKIGDAFSPWMITSAVWLGIFVMFSLFGYNLYPLENRLYTCVMIWVPILVLTSVATYYALPVPERADVNSKIEVSNKSYTFLLIIAAICSPLYLYQIVKVAMMFDMGDILNNIRVFSSYGEKNTLVKLLQYVIPINQALFIVEMWRYPNGGKLKFYTILLANILCTIAVMSKTPIFILFLSTLYVLYEKQRIKISSMVMWGIVILAGFYGLNVLRKPEAEQDSSTFFDFFLCMSFHHLSHLSGRKRNLPISLAHFHLRSFMRLHQKWDWVHTIYRSNYRILYGFQYRQMSILYSSLILRILVIKE